MSQTHPTQYDSNMMEMIDLQPLPESLSIEQVKKSLVERWESLLIHLGSSSIDVVIGACC